MLEFEFSTKQTSCEDTLVKLYSTVHVLVRRTYGFKSPLEMWMVADPSNRYKIVMLL
jgi:hypothetical protein